MSEQAEQTTTKDYFDKVIGSLVGIPDVVSTKPTTIRAVMPLIGASQTFIVQTYRNKESGDTVFIEYVAANTAIRIVLPPEVANVIARQRDALTGRNRSRAAKEAMAERMRAGWKPNFKTGRKARKG